MDPKQDSSASHHRDSSPQASSSSLVTIVLDQENCTTNNSAHHHLTADTSSTAQNYVSLAQVTSSEIVEQLTSSNALQTPTTSDSSLLIGSSLEFNQYRDVDVHSLASSKRTDDSNASTARSHPANTGRVNRMRRHDDESDEELTDNDRVMKDTAKDKNRASNEQTTANRADLSIDETNENQANENEIANIWIQEENQAEAAEASPVFSNEDSVSNQLDHNNPESHEHFSISSPNDESFADNSNHSLSDQPAQSQVPTQPATQILPQSTLTPMPLMADSTTATTSNQLPSSSQPSLETTTATTTRSQLNDNNARTSSTLISNTSTNEAASSNSISHYSIFTRIRSQLSTSQTNLAQPTQLPSQYSSMQSISSDTPTPKRKQSTFKFEPKSTLFHKFVEEYYKEFADVTDPSMTSSTLKDANLPGFSFNEENYKAFYKLSKLFLGHENYYCTMFLPFNNMYKYPRQDSFNDFPSAVSSSEQQAHKSESKMLHSLVQRLRQGADEGEKSVNQTPNSPINNDEFEAMIAAVTGINRSKPPAQENSNSSCLATSMLSQKSGSQSQSPSESPMIQADRKASQNSNLLQKSSEFFTCSLCLHYLHEPITLVCGCSFCRNCLNEYNRTMERVKFRETVLEMRLRKRSRTAENESLSSTENVMHDDLLAELGSDSSEDEEEQLMKIMDEKDLFRKYSYKQNKVILHQCYNCGKAHDHNTLEHLKVNVFISKLVDKLWSRSVEVRQFRNDIRHFICYEMEIYDTFNLHKYEYLLKQAYEMDQSNHLIIADLFMINYFSGCLENCLKYANMAVQLRPNWPFSYYMRAIYYQQMNDIYRLKLNLILCLHLDPTIEQIRIKLCQILIMTNQLTDSPASICPYAKKLKMNNSLASSTSANDQLDELSDMGLPKTSSAPYKRARSSNYDGNQNESSSLNKHQKFNAAFNQETSYDSSPDSMNSYEDDKTSSQSMTENREGSASKNSSSGSPPEQRQQQSTLNTISQDSQSSESNQKSDDITKYLSLNSSLIKVADLECSLCYRLILDPVTTPCGHSFCCSCLDRSLDHQDRCPLCKHSLAEYLAERRSNTTSFIEKLIRIYFPNEHDDRKKQHEEELRDLNSDDEIPIFVCTLALPNAPCPLHIYEPRYRLMLRRAIESGSKQFGMCMYSERTQHRYTEYGTVLKIQNFQFSRDGRAIVNSIGAQRFKVVRSSTKDGYNVAKVEWVKDERASSAQDVTELQQLHDEVYQLAITWFSYIPSIQKNKILEIYGLSEIPSPEEDIQSNDNGPAWHWFVLSILPLENDFQYKFLTKTSLKDRLRQMKRIILVMLKPFERGPSSLPASLSSSTTNLAQDETAAGSNSLNVSPSHNRT